MPELYPERSDEQKALIKRAHHIRVQIFADSITVKEIAERLGRNAKYLGLTLRGGYVGSTTESLLDRIDTAREEILAERAESKAA